MIDFPIVDTHLHVWDPGRLRYPWLADIPPLNRPFQPADYGRACGPVRVEKMVFVQAECEFAQYKEECDWVTSLAAAEPRIEGIVPWAPLEKGDAARAELRELAANRLVKGIRRMIQLEPDPGFCIRPDFIRGVRMLPDFNMHFEICIAHHQMENTIELVRQCPGVRFILDHIGKPDIRNGLLDPWRTHLRALAAMPNVCCKMSGLVTEADFESWTAEDLKPYVDHVLDCFGFNRTMYGSDWPVATLATDYPRWVETLEWAVGGCSPVELKKLFRDNAIGFYRLDGPVTSTE